MHFRITPHSAAAPPAGALELLWQHLGATRDEVSFEKVGAEITATTGEDAPVSMTRDERIHIGRHVVLDILTEVCEAAPDLRSDWFAVSSEP
ncbi:MAG: hypothetical protein ACRDJX_03735 [Solirubrobacteraceae bacterium]